MFVYNLTLKKQIRYKSLQLCQRLIITVAFRNLANMINYNDILLSLIDSRI